jgi:hypothetical protein
MTFEVNNQGIMEIEQAEHDGAVDVIVWDSPVKNEQGIDTRGVRHGDVISAGDMVMLMNYYHYQKEHGAPIFECESSTINDMRAFLKMIRFDQLPEPARSLAESLKSRLS